LNAQEADELGGRIAALVQDGQVPEGYALLAPVLAKRTPFRLLGRIGEAVGAGPPEAASPEWDRRVNAFLDHIAAAKTEGGWVVIGTALGRQLERDMAGAFDRCRGYIVAAGVWYGADILGERVPGPALVADFEPALTQLASWRNDEDAWVRRAVGVSVHFWAKRSRGAEKLRSDAQALLDFLDPMFEEWEMDAVKGVGWGLKTLGKNYPGLVADWLAEQVVERQRRHRTLMLRKASTYLPSEQQARLEQQG
jgi:hypothetical protein